MRIYIAGHQGLVGSSIARHLSNHTNHEWVGTTRSDLDITDVSKTTLYLKELEPDAVIIAAAKVGGILANNTFPVEFLLENLKIQNSLLEAAYHAKIKKLIFLGSSCIYPKEAPQPLKEKYLLTGPLEETNEAYAIAKIAGVKLVDSYRKQFGVEWVSAMPTNLYGPFDNFDSNTSHVLPAIIKKLHEAKINGSRRVSLLGTGKPLREFLYVDDLAYAIVKLLESTPQTNLINIGSSQEVSIRDLAHLVARIVGYEGEVTWDESAPDGTFRKLLDSSKIHELGWRPLVSLEEGIRSTYNWYLASSNAM